MKSTQTVNKLALINWLVLQLKCFLYHLQDITSHTIPWRIQEYEDLTVIEGESVIFTWQGFHSLHQVSYDSNKINETIVMYMYS